MLAQRKYSQLDPSAEFMFYLMSFDSSLYKLSCSGPSFPQQWRSVAESFWL